MNDSGGSAVGALGSINCFLASVGWGCGAYGPPLNAGLHAVSLNLSISIFIIFAAAKSSLSIAIHFLSSS